MNIGSIVNIPGTTIHIYSLVVGVAILFTFIASWIKFKIRKIPTRTLEWAIFIILPVGLLGARLWFVANNPQVVHSVLDVFAVWNGGIAIEGGVTVGMIVGTIIFYQASGKMSISLFVFLDCIVPNILLGQAIGRWGNFFNQEVMGNISYDHPFWWLPAWINDNLHYPDESGGYRAPLFLYESFLDLFFWCSLTFVVPKLGKWSSIQPWDQESEKYACPSSTYPLSKDMWWNWKQLFIALRNRRQESKKIWAKAYYEYFPLNNKTFRSPLKPLLIYKSPSNNWFIKLKAWLMFRWKKFRLFWAQENKSFNENYNPYNYQVTKAGVTGGSYFIFYAIIRACLEPLREARDLMMINGVSTSLIISIFWVFMGCVIVIVAQFIAPNKFRKKGWYYERQY